MPDHVTRNTPIQIAGWVLKLAAAAFFLSAGLSKLAGAERQIALFAAIGWGDWFRYLTGVVECVGAALLLYPMNGIVGVVVLFGVSVGALLTLALLGLPLLPAIASLLWVGIIGVVVHYQAGKPFSRGEL